MQFEVSLAAGRLRTARVKRLRVRERRGRSDRRWTVHVILPATGSLGEITITAMLAACENIADEVRRTGMPPRAFASTRRERRLP